MRDHFRPSVLALAAIIIVAVVAVAVTRVTRVKAQTPTAQRSTAVQFSAGYKAPRTADGKPDLNGVWQQFTTAEWDIQDHAAAKGRVVALADFRPVHRSPR